MATPMMTAEPSERSVSMRQNVPHLAHPRYHMGDGVGVEATEALREYKDCTEGLGSRFALTGHHDMRAGKRTSPHGYALRFLRAGRKAGLPRAWAERWVMWQQLVVARLWSDDRTPYLVLEQREQEAEHVCNLAHLRALRDPSPENIQALYEARLAEASAEMAVLSHPEARA